jgi:formylglycine-generating enzyme required for sulfatase activity
VVARHAPRLAFCLVVVISLGAFGGERSAELGPEVSDLDDEVLDEADGLGWEADVEPLAGVDGGRRPQKRGGCPLSMVRQQDFCIDRFEAPNRRGEKPLVMQSANDAEAWCSARRKRLCTEDEWEAACEGDERWAYPYGPIRVDRRCNDDQPWRKVNEPTLAKWPAPEAKAHVKELDQRAPSGADVQCVSQAGVHDLTGNVEEWVVRTREHANAWPYVLIGCYWSGCYGGGKPTCHSTNDAHGPEFRYYETGFRCCRDAGLSREGRKSLPPQ